VVDRSANASAGGFPIGWAPGTWPAGPSDATVFDKAPGWRLAGRRLRLVELLRQGRGHPNDQPGYEARYKVLILVVGLMPARLEATLGRMGCVLALLTVGIWSAAAVAGHWLCLRALTPLRRMARAAGAMTAADRGWRLPAPGTGDELDELGRAFNGLLERLHDAFARLNEAYERQQQFAGDASHQLRTPLAALLGQVQLARRRDRAPEEYRRVLDLVEAEGTRLRQIVDTLLFLAQPDRADLPCQPVDLAVWVPDHLHRWSAHARAADLHAEITGDPPPMVRVYPTLLAQLLDNLLENAFKYSLPGTPVIVRGWREHGAVALAVEDRGCGLSAEDVTHVFEPFFRAEPARREGQSGVGLGLSVARRIAATFGGSLDVRSEPGKGSAFVLRLPSAILPSGPAGRGRTEFGEVHHEYHL
jgi:two-component system, OmpR family, sensor kinase